MTWRDGIVCWFDDVAFVVDTEKLCMYLYDNCS